MEKPKTLHGYCYYLSIASLLLFTYSCASFPKGIKHFKNNDFEKAETLFEKSVNHAHYDLGARYYLAKLSLNKTKGMAHWIDVEKTYCSLGEAMNAVSRKKRLKLAKHDIRKSTFLDASSNLQSIISEHIAQGATVSLLASFDREKSCWSSKKLDTIYTTVVNKNIAPHKDLFENKFDAKWKNPPLQRPEQAELLNSKDYSCQALFRKAKPAISYDDFILIKKHYTQYIAKNFYIDFQGIDQNAWALFEMDKSYCEMDQFKADNPNSAYLLDCAYDAAADTLCMGDIKALLAFHRNNKHSLFDISTCIQILCLGITHEERSILSKEEQEQFADIELMMNINDLLISCEPQKDLRGTLTQLQYLKSKYAHHDFVHQLSLLFIYKSVDQKELELAQEAIQTLRLEFEDSHCSTLNPLLKEKIAQYEQSEALLIRLKEGKDYEVKKDYPWNTSTQDEYALVSWGETDEVFFVRRGTDGINRIMRSVLQKGAWTKGTAVEELCFATDVEPLSMSSAGRLMLLRSEGKLYTSQRLNKNRAWSLPKAMKTPKNFAGDAWISPNDSLMLISYYTSPPSPLNAFEKSFAVAFL